MQAFTQNRVQFLGNAWPENECNFSKCGLEEKYRFLPYKHAG